MECDVARCIAYISINVEYFYKGQSYTKIPQKVLLIVIVNLSDLLSWKSYYQIFPFVPNVSGQHCF